MTTRKIDTTEGILEILGSVDSQKVRSELWKLQGIHHWALDNLGVDYKVGDRVVLTRNQGTQRDSGWYCYRECLVVGATAVVEEIDFWAALSSPGGRWMVTVKLDREWSVHEWGLPGKGEVRRYWDGPVDEMPDGMTPPYSGQDSRHVFSLPVGDVRKGPPADPETCDACGRDFE